MKRFFPPVRRRTRLSHSFWIISTLIALCAGGGCAGDDALSANQAMQALLRTQQGVTALNQARRLTDPFRHVSEAWTDEDIAYAIDDAYGDCADTAQTESGTRITVDDDCILDNVPCSGQFTYTIEREETDHIARNWIVLTNVDMRCHDLRFRGNMRMLPMVATPELPYQAELRISTLSIQELGDSAPEDNTVTDFQGQFFVREDIVTPIDGDAFPVTILNGQASFHDPELERNWAMETQDLGIFAYNVTPRTGIIQLRSTPDDTWFFRTNWWALSANATRVRVESGKDVWIGCISHNDSQACDED